jgi:Fe2+ or Zn2+ uptake regulation protein
MTIPNPEHRRHIDMFEDTCYMKGLNATQHRMKVLCELADNVEHSETEAIYQWVRKCISKSSPKTSKFSIRPGAEG